MQAQITHLGYVDIVDERYARMAAVLSLDTKYSPKLKLYSLKHGTVVDCKIDKKTFGKTKLSEGDIVKIQSTKDKPKTRRNENGEWESIPGTKETWITAYQIIKDL